MSTRISKIVLAAFSFLLFFYFASMVYASGQNEKKTNPAPATTSQSQPTKNSIKVAVPDRIVRLDPSKATGIGSLTAIKQMFQPLMTYDSSGSVVPLLAEKPAQETGPKQFVVTLRQGVTFSNGDALTATDVKATFDRILNPKTGSLLARVLDYIASVKVVDSSKVQFNLKIAMPADLFNQKLTGIDIMSAKAIKEYAGSLATHPVGTGPFKLKEWIQGDHLTMIKNPNYWQKGWPKLDSITMVTVPEGSIRAMNLRLGQFDVITRVPPNLADVLKKSSNVTVSDIPAYLYTSIWFNDGKKPFNDPRVRKAVAYALNLNSIAKTAYYGYAKPSFYILPKWSPAYSDTIPPAYSQNIAKAKQLLAEAGYPNGFQFQMLVGNLSDLVDTATLVQSMLAKVGITANIKMGEVESLYTYVFDHSFDAFVTWGNTAGIFGPDPNILLRWLLYKGGFWQWNTPGRKKVDKLLDDALSTPSAAQRRQMYAQVETIQHNEVPLIILVYRDFLSAWDKNLKGVVPNSSTVIDLTKAYFQK